MPSGSVWAGRNFQARCKKPLRVTYKVSIEIEGRKRPACVAEVIGQHYR
jgi:hypothetical protein